VLRALVAATVMVGWSGCRFGVPPWPGEVAGSETDAAGAEADAAPKSCNTPTECDDGNACTQDYCTNQVCENARLVPRETRCGETSMFEGCSYQEECQPGLGCHAGRCVPPCWTVEDCEQEDTGLIPPESRWVCDDKQSCTGYRRVFRCDPPGGVWPGGCVPVVDLDDPTACQKCEGAACGADTDCMSEHCADGRCTRICTTSEHCKVMDTIDCSTCQGTGHTWTCSAEGSCVRDTGATASPARCLGKECGPDSLRPKYTCLPDANDTQQRLYCTNDETGAGLAGLKFVWVPAGAARIGTGTDPTGSAGYLALFGDGYFIHKYEQTNDVVHIWLDKYHKSNNDCGGDACIQYKPPDEAKASLRLTGAWEIKGVDAARLTMAATGLTWAGARDYCTHLDDVISGLLGQEVGVRVELCTEAQWEKAARGGCDKWEDCVAPEYPWGAAAPTCNECFFAIEGSCSQATGQVTLRPAGASPYGAYDMSGNVDEWVLESRWHPDYDDVPLDGLEWTWGGETGHLFRGGNQKTTSPDELKSTYRRYESDPGVATPASGVRCCMFLE
jgi:formylglycine-generating enzyme required for sulfatase activity